MSIIGEIEDAPEEQTWTVEERRDSPDLSDADEAEPSSTHALFDGDEGGLELEVRRTLVVLLKNPFITSESNPREWKTLIISRPLIGARLNDLFLELVVDVQREVAYKRPATSDTGTREFPTLVYNAAWQREETALLVYLRVRERSERARGEMQVRVSRVEMLDYLRENRPEAATNQVADDRRADRAIGAIRSAGLLIKTDEDGVYRISPAIEPMLPIPTLNSLLTWLTERTTQDDDAGHAPAQEETP